MTTSRFGRANRRRFVASSVIGGVAILTAGQSLRAEPRTSQAPMLLLQGGVSSDVTMFRGNAARTGEMPGAGPDALKGVEVLWSFEISGDFLSPTLAVVDGLVYVGSADGICMRLVPRRRPSAGDSRPAMGPDHRAVSGQRTGDVLGITRWNRGRTEDPRGIQQPRVQTTSAGTVHVR